MLEAADPDAHERVVDGDVRAAADERAAAARRALRAVAGEVVANARRGQGAGADDHGRDDREHDPASSPSEHRGEHDARGERGEARLRVREVEPGPDERDRSRGAEQPAPVAPEQHDDEQREDRDDQEAPVDGRVPEDRVDPVEGRVGVRDEQLLVPEQVARLVLVDPDRREEGGHRRHLDEQPERDQPAPPQASERDREEAEREVEEEQLDRALADVLRPDHREAAPADERRQRPRDRAELASARVALPELPGQQERRRRDDAVHRHEQVRLGRADVDVDARGHAGKHGERQHEGPAAEQEGAADHERDPDDGRAGEQRPVPVRRQVDGEHDRPERPRAQAGEPLHPSRREEQRREAQAGDGARDLRAHFVTTTIARATCPSVATRKT